MLSTIRRILNREGKPVRGYCWRIGHAIALTVPCCECGSKEAHEPLEDQSKCGSFAPCLASGMSDYSGDRHGGHPCTLPYNHDSDHYSDQSAACLEEHRAEKESIRRLSAPNE